MNLLIAVDYGRRVIRFSESNNVYYSIRSLVNRDGFKSDCIYQAVPISADAIRIMKSQLVQHRIRGNDKGKEYKLDSYRVRSYCKVLGCKIPYFDPIKDEYDLLTCRICGELFEAVYDNVDNIYRLNEIIIKDNYCSDQCQLFKEGKCIVCAKTINSTYMYCSGKCEVIDKTNKKWKEDTIKKEQKRAWEV